jgi:hypothetical protein
LDGSKSQKNANQMITVNWLQGLFPDANVIELQELLNIFKSQKLIKFTDISGLDEDSLKEALSAVPFGRRSKDTSRHIALKRTLLMGWNMISSLIVFMDMNDIE